MKVKILKCTDLDFRNWYVIYIGKVVEVHTINDKYYNMVGGLISPLLKEDCILIEEYRDKLINMIND